MTPATLVLPLLAQTTTGPGRIVYEIRPFARV